jgi:uncharacterized membrane protein
MMTPTTELVAELAAAPGAIPSALVAYGHYLSFMVGTACVTAERLTIKPAMSMEEEKVMTVADTTYGLTALLLVYTGYLRVTQYGKGWEFYQHEPIFWVKMTLLAVAGAASFFPTTIIIQRAIEQQKLGDTPIAPMSEKLAARMTSVLNAELLAFFSIPLAATLMSRGVGYANWLPWQAGATPVVLVLGGLGFKYVKEALDWTEDPVDAAADAAVDAA